MRRIPVLLLALALAACVPPPVLAPGPAPAGLPPAPTATASSATTPPGPMPNLVVKPLPGGLDATPVLNTNSPEVLKGDGVLVSTAGGTGANLDYAFEGAFEVFSHHFADHVAGSDTTWLGLLARNDGTGPATVRLLAGASWLSRPDAPYLTLGPLVDDPAGKTYAGPGSRVVTDLLHGRSPLAPTSWTLAPGEARALLTLPIPTTTMGLPNRNGRSGLLRLTTDAPIRLAEVARLGRAAAAPGEADLRAVWDAAKLAGPRDAAPTAYNPAPPPPQGALRYGRVSGVSVGARWTGTLADAGALAAGARIGWPIASVVLNTIGTRQIQAPAMARRYPDTAVQAQGSYGVAYALALPLVNPDAAPRRYAIALVSPRKMADGEAGPPRFLPPAGQRVTFRGPVRVDWADPAGGARHAAAHLVLHEGEEIAPFATLTVPAGGRLDAKVTLIYPADCTPPQLLTVHRL